MSKCTIVASGKTEVDVDGLGRHVLTFLIVKCAIGRGIMSLLMVLCGDNARG